mmetsp:Transcript_17471/g.48465  ORF Transcript_17471/g.48465 Transcript_17471/m.48465 type:complete len:213 (+) Transcript_17471:689-1327(+)
MHIMLTQTTQNVDKELPADRLHGSTDKSTKQASQRMMVEIGVQCLGGWGSLLLFLLLLDLADVGDGGGEVAAGLDQLTFLGGLELGGVGNIVGVVVILEWRVGDWSGKILSRLDGISDIGVAQLAGVGNSVCVVVVLVWCEGDGCGKILTGLDSSSDIRRAESVLVGDLDAEVRKCVWLESGNRKANTVGKRQCRCWAVNSGQKTMVRTMVR